jgi:hypothetical protein
MPSLGSPVPAPTILAVVHCPLQVQVQTVGTGKESTPTLQLSSIPLPGSCPAPTGYINTPRLENAPNMSSATKEEEVILEVTFVCLTDDGKLWQWNVGSQVHLDVNGHRYEPVFKVQ